MLDGLKRLLLLLAWLGLVVWLADCRTGHERMQPLRPGAYRAE